MLIVMCRFSTFTVASLIMSHIFHNDGHPNLVYLLQREKHLSCGRPKRPNWNGPGSHLAALIES